MFHYGVGVLASHTLDNRVGYETLKNTQYNRYIFPPFQEVYKPYLFPLFIASDYVFYSCGYKFFVHFSIGIFTIYRKSVFRKLVFCL